MKLKLHGRKKELEDNGIGDAMEDEDQQNWSFFSGDNYIISGFDLIICGEKM